jgi:hypothetical protein
MVDRLKNSDQLQTNRTLKIGKKVSEIEVVVPPRILLQMTFWSKRLYLLLSTRLTELVHFHFARIFSRWNQGKNPNRDSFREIATITH